MPAKRKPVKVYVAGARPNIQAALERAVRLWNDAVGAKVLEIVPDGTPGAVPIRIANERNDWYEGVEADEEAEFTGLTGKGGMVRGTRQAFLSGSDEREGETPLTLEHELGHALGLFHPATTSTAERYIPATAKRVERGLERNDPSAWRVAPVGIMGNEMNPNSPNYRGRGPSQGEVEFLRKRFGVTNPTTRPRDTTSAVRNAPAKITGMSSRPQLIATARYLSARIARLLGVKEIPVSELDINWEELEGAAGLYRAPGLLGDKGDLDLDPDQLGMSREPTDILAHELAHAYMFRSLGGAAVGDKDGPWVQESLANYVAAKIGYIQRIQGTPEDPRLGYTAGARFLAWMDEYQPNAGLAFTKLMTTGLISADDAAKRITKQPLEYLLAAYENNPFVADPVPGPFARMLRTRASLDFLGQRAMDSYLKKSKQFMRQVEAARAQEARETVAHRWWQLTGDKLNDPAKGRFPGTRATKPGPAAAPPPVADKGVVREENRPIHKAPEPQPASKQLR